MRLRPKMIESHLGGAQRTLPLELVFGSTRCPDQFCQSQLRPRATSIRKLSLTLAALGPHGSPRVFSGP